MRRGYPDRLMRVLLFNRGIAAGRASPPHRFFQREFGAGDSTPTLHPVAGDLNCLTLDNSTPDTKRTMTPDSDLAYEHCYQAVLNHYSPSGTRGLRRSTEKLLAVTLAWQADETGLLPALEPEQLADLCGLPATTFRRYLAVLVDTGWLVEFTEDYGVVRRRINSTWLQSLPVKRTAG